MTTATIRLRMSAGYSYVEVLVATVLLAVTLVPAIKALHNASLASEINQSMTVQHYRLFRLMEQVMAESYNALEIEAITAGSPDVPTNYSDPVGTQNRRLLYLSRADGDNADGDDDLFTGTDDGLLWVKAEIEGTVQSMENLVTL